MCGKVLPPHGHKKVAIASDILPEFCPIIRKPQAFPKSYNRSSLMSHYPEGVHMAKTSYKYLAFHNL